MPEEPKHSEAEADPAKPAGWLAAGRNEVREHPMPYFVLLLFVIAGPLVAHLLFPEAPRGAGLFGGVAFGIYACLTAMPGRFI